MTKILYSAAHKVDWRKVGKFLSYPKAFNEEVFKNELHDWMRSLKFYDKNLSPERRKLKVLALFNYLWECNSEKLEQDQDEWWPKDVCQYSNSGFYSILPLLYIETSTWEIDKMFWGKACPSPSDYWFGNGEVMDHEMFGIASMLKAPSCGNVFTDDRYAAVLSHLHNADWVNKYEKSPAAYLGLGFHVQGWLDANYSSKSYLTLQYPTILGFVSHALSAYQFLGRYQHAFSEWGQRFLMFVLAQRLFVSRDVEDREHGFERYAFSILYLLFYRKGLDDIWGSKSLGALWANVSEEEKEEEAARCRRLIIDCQR